MPDVIKICSVGDLMICDSPLYASVGVGSRYTKIRTKLLETCKEQFGGMDITIGNFETVVYSPNNRSLKEVQMACPGTVVEDLKQMGFSILNLANNHSLQHGTVGFETTINACIKNNIEPIGLRDQKPFIVTIKGKKLAFLSLCIHIEWYQPDNILYENRIQKILDDIHTIKKNKGSDIIVISVHWGDEFATYPSNAQVALAHTLVDNGANIILGHHSHVFQGIEEYKGAIIAYSQGNFISDMIPELCRQTACLMLDINDEKIQYRIVSLYISDNYIPEPNDTNWYDERKTQLLDVINNKIDDNQYWKNISHNHAIGHKNYVNYFKSHIHSYKISVLSRMIFDFGIRKAKRMIGTSTDGRVSSMDPLIMNEIQKHKL